MGKKTGFFYFREIFGIILSVATLGTAAPIIVNVYIDNPKIFNDLETCKKYFIYLWSSGLGSASLKCN